MSRYVLLAPLFLTLCFAASAQKNSSNYLMILDDATFDIGIKTVSVIALDDRAPLSSNPHFRAMWNLVRLGANLEALLQGRTEPLNDVNLGEEFGTNGYNKTVLALFFRYGFGESSDFKLQKHFLELALSPGYFKNGNGMHVHLEYQLNLAKTGYGSGVASIERSIDYEIYAGARIGFDWSSSRSESEAGFFSHLNSEIKRIAYENDFTASQLIMLEDLAEDSRILLPEDVGGRAFFVGPVAGARLSKKIFKTGRLFLDGTGFYDLMDLTGGQHGKENKRSQHSLTFMLGFKLTLGAEGEMKVLDFF